VTFSTHVAAQDRSGQRRPGCQWFRGLLAVGLGMALATAGCGGSAVRAAPSLVVLSCRASAGGQPADPTALPVNGVESAALQGDTNPYDTLPAWKSQAGRHYLVWKAFLAVAPTAGPYRVVTASSPGSARLFYASPARWGAVSGEGVVSSPPRSVRLPACGRNYAGYTGGILVSGPACVTITVTGPHTAARAVRVPILITHC
jgi:hypothetical protein